MFPHLSSAFASSSVWFHELTLPFPSSPRTCDQLDGVCSEPLLCRGHLVPPAPHQRAHHKVRRQGQARSHGADRPHAGGQRRGHHDRSAASLQRTAPRDRLHAPTPSSAIYLSVSWSVFCLGCGWYFVQSDPQPFGDYGVVAACNALRRAPCSLLERAHLGGRGSATAVHRLPVRSVRLHLWRRGSDRLHHGPHAGIRFGKKPPRFSVVVSLCFHVVCRLWWNANVAH